MAKKPPSRMYPTRDEMIDEIKVLKKKLSKATARANDAEAANRALRRRKEGDGNE